MCAQCRQHAVNHQGRYLTNKLSRWPVWVGKPVSGLVGRRQLPGCFKYLTHPLHALLSSPSPTFTPHSYPTTHLITGPSWSPNSEPPFPVNPHLTRLRETPQPRILQRSPDFCLLQLRFATVPRNRQQPFFLRKYPPLTTISNHGRLKPPSSRGIRPNISSHRVPVPPSASTTTCSSPHNRLPDRPLANSSKAHLCLKTVE